MKKRLILLSLLLISCNTNIIVSSNNEESFNSDFSYEEVLSDNISNEDIVSPELFSFEESFFSEESISADNTTLDIENYINYMMDETSDYIPSWSKEGFKGRWNYIDGVMLTSLLNMYEIKQDDKYKDFVINYVNYYINKNGEFVNLIDSSLPGYNQGYELDTICESRILYKLYELTNDERYLKAIDITYNQIKTQPRTNEGNFIHKNSYPNQVWLDGLYMVMPFYSMYANENEDVTINVNDKDLSLYGDILSQYKNVRKYMFDEERELYYHGYDESKSIFWANKETGCSSSFWLRSLGWYIVSLIDVIDITNDVDTKNYLKELFVEIINGVLKYQDESKMFYQVVDKGNIKVYVPGKYFSDERGKYVTNYLETSGSSMIAYALLKGSRLKVLDKSYFEKGKEIFLAIKDNYFKVENNNYYLDSICITAGLGPEGNTKRDGSLEYYLSEKVGSNDAKGVGPFIMAYSELIR